jgi:hypothetical protein
VDHFDNYFTKGYFARAYGLKEGYFLQGLTLKDVISLRTKASLKYTDMEIFEFMMGTLKTLEFLET